MKHCNEKSQSTNTWIIVYGPKTRQTEYPSGRDKARERTKSSPPSIFASSWGLLYDRPPPAHVIILRNVQM